MTWRTPLRLVLTVGPPLAGILLIGQAAVASIGGEIHRWEFALGALCMALSFAARLVAEGVSSGPRATRGDGSAGHARRPRCR
ncbi:hypothetical protein [Methylobacterium nodulans]|uniref:Uncharacterized protein n=1 Tax=Methylobacterium nodulans (strain LMG 21967 / CNCM I-2342 / ORS 2060) TaxID=460265 RepID=B8IPZ2_METNO|nr:hypothetical protein [Methylobacterium nodulans]ACL56642.1 hypothetical protein Mnod_1652 [Methylobacterium nodulans ORS 2060]